MSRIQTAILSHFFHITLVCLIRDDGGSGFTLQMVKQFRSTVQPLVASGGQCHNWVTYIEIAMKYFTVSGASVILARAMADSAIAANLAHVQ